MRRSRVARLGAVVAAGLLVAALPGSAFARTRARVRPPTEIAKAGKIVYWSDITYPPEEFYRKGSTSPAGSDVDIGTQIARLMGVKAQFDNTGFDGIIPALLGHKCNAIISGMNDTAKRRHQVSFVDYLRVGQSLMVQKGNVAEAMRRRLIESTACRSRGGEGKDASLRRGRRGSRADRRVAERSGNPLIATGQGIQHPDPHDMAFGVAIVLLEIRSASGSGTTAEVRLPLNGSEPHPPG